MSKHVIHIKLTPKSIDKAIKEVEEKKKWLDEKTQELVKLLGEEGVRTASLKFSEAIYAGYNNVECKIEDRGENKVAVIAFSQGEIDEDNAVLFIEFGTGVVYPDNHPEKPEGLLGRGEYGSGHGKNPEGWDYTGTAAYQGSADFKHSTNIDGLNVYHTKGNPANMCMYKTVRELEEDFTKIARRVFK